MNAENQLEFHKEVCKENFDPNELPGGICVPEGEKETYIYICGIKPVREICIDEHVTLEPVAASPKSDDMIDSIMKYGNHSEFQMGVLISTLRLVTAQLKMTADHSEELAVLAWNAQHICVQISAMLNCAVSWYFQADTSAEKFDAHTRLFMVTPNMYACPPSVTVVEEQQCIFLEQSLKIALDLEWCPEYGHASNAAWCYRAHFNPAVQLSVLWGGIEALFLIERHIRRDLSIAASRFLHGDDSEAERIKQLYAARCKAVHELDNQDDNTIVQSANLLHALLCKCVERNAIPDVTKLLEVPAETC